MGLIGAYNSFESAPTFGAGLTNVAAGTRAGQDINGVYNAYQNLTGQPNTQLIGNTVASTSAPQIDPEKHLGETDENGIRPFNDTFKTAAKGILASIL